MKASDLIQRLQEIKDEHGDLDIVSEFGELSDIDPIRSARVINVDKSGSDDWPWFYRPWDQGTPTNAKAIILTDNEDAP